MPTRLTRTASPRRSRSTRSKHSLFGASKVAADVMVQEYGRYFGMPTCCLRGGCLTGPNHCGVELHGFLSYLVQCNLEGREYTVFGYKGKQVRDNIHSRRRRPVHRTRSSTPRAAARSTTSAAARPTPARSSKPSRWPRDLRAAAAVHVRRQEPDRRSHLLLQRPREDARPLSAAGTSRSASSRRSARSSRPGSRSWCRDGFLPGRKTWWVRHRSLGRLFAPVLPQPGLISLAESSAWIDPVRDAEEPGAQALEVA